MCNTRETKKKKSKFSKNGIQQKDKLGNHKRTCLKKHTYDDPEKFAFDFSCILAFFSCVCHLFLCICSCVCDATWNWCGSRWIINQRWCYMCCMVFFRNYLQMFKSLSAAILMYTDVLMFSCFVLNESVISELMWFLMLLMFVAMCFCFRCLLSL